MEKWVTEWLNKERKDGKKRLEVKRFGKKHYVYESTTKWDKNSKKVRKVSKYMGRLTKDGFFEGQKKVSVRSIYEYGSSSFLELMAQPLLAPLKQSFPRRYKEIIAMAMVKTIDPQPIKLIKSRWEKLHASTNIEASLSPNTLSSVLKEIGSDARSQMEFFEKITKGKQFLLFDLSCVFSRSENLNIAEKGYNKEHSYVPQVNIAMLFSSDEKLPAMIKVIPGSVRDVKSFKKVLEETSLKNIVIIIDRGMSSPDIITKNNDVSFIMPLKRNSKVIDYSMKLDKLLVYRERGIKCGKVETSDGKFLYLFEDVKMRSEEENTFISLVVNKKKTESEMESKSCRFGRIAILSDLDVECEDVYLMYKIREDVECAFDVLKNPLESDKTYLGNDDAVRGYFFVSFVSLYIYYSIMNILRKGDMLKKVSVRELLLELSKVYAVSDGNRKLITEIPGKVETLLKKLDIDLFPKS